MELSFNLSEYFSIIKSEKEKNTGKEKQKFLFSDSKPSMDSFKEIKMSLLLKSIN